MAGDAAVLAAGLWVGIVRYQRDRLLYENAISGELPTVLPREDKLDGEPVPVTRDAACDGTRQHRPAQ